MKEKQKIQKNLKNDMIVLFVLELLLFGYTLSKGNFNFMPLIYAVFLLLAYFQANKGEKIAGIIGIIVAILMMLSIVFFDLIDFLLGLFVLIHSLKYYKIFK